MSRLRELPGHVFWTDAVSLLDPEVCDVNRLTTSGQVTDSYLLALAVANSGSLATFDKRLVTSAICGADAALVVLPADQACRGDPIEPWRRCSPPDVWERR